MTERQRFHERIEAEFNELAGRLGRGLNRLEAEARRQASHFPDRLDAFEQKIRDLKAAGDERWKEAKPGLERSWTEFRDAVDKVLRRE